MLIRTLKDFIGITQKEFNEIIPIDELSELQNNTERWKSLDNLPGEIWREIDNTKGRYSVSIYGRIKQNPVTILFNQSNRNPYYKHLNEKILNTYFHSTSKYPMIDIFGRKKFVHRIVAETFLKNDDLKNKNVVDHINTVRDCNHIFNLRFCTNSENMSNPLTKNNSSKSKKGIIRFKIEECQNASSEDLISDYLNLENIFSARMFSLIDFSGEEWRFNSECGIYVSNYGRLKKYSKKRKKMFIIKQTFNPSGYLTSLYKKFTHRLVMETFVGLMPEDKECVDHINTIRYDNRLINLRYVTKKENSANELTVEKQKSQLNKHSFTKVLLYDAVTGEFIQEYDSLNKLSTELKLNSESQIVNAIRNRSVLLNKYLVIYKNKNGKIDSKIKPTDRNMFKSISKYDLDGNYIKTFDSVYDIEDDSSRRHLIIKCCLGEVKSSYGYMWRFSDGTTSNIPMYRRNNIKLVNQYDGITGDYIKTFKSGKDASSELGLCDSVITEACDNHKICRGFAFRFVDDFNQTQNLSDYDSYTETANYKFKKCDNFAINKYSYDGKYIETLNSIYECKDYLRHRILMCCLGKMNVYGGYMWKFAKDVKGTNDIEPYIHKHFGEFMKINMYNIYGQYLKTFNSPQDVIDNVSFKVPYSQLIECCHGKIDTLKGYFFRYTYNENTLDLWDSGLYYVNENNDVYKKSQFENKNKINDSEKTIIIYDALTGFLIKRYYSASVCASELGCDRNVLRHMSFINNKYIVVLSTIHEEVKLTISVPKHKIASIRPINKYSIDGKYICTYANISEASFDKLSRHNILNACNRKTKQYNGYQWRWSYNVYDDITSVEEQCKTQNTINNKIVVMYDYETNEVIQKFNSPKEAAEVLQIKKFKIIDCCLNRLSKIRMSNENSIFFRYEII